MTKDMNPMRKIGIGKITLNIGAGREQKQLMKAVKLLELVAGRSPVKTVTSKRLAAWGLRPGLPIGCKLTLRGNDHNDLLKRLIAARDGVIPKSAFDDFGNISFGIKEYIDIPGVRYDPSIGIMGLQVSITLERPGYRIKVRRLKKVQIPRHHRVTRDESIAFMKENFSVKLAEEVEEE